MGDSKEIGLRLKGLRDGLDLSIEDFATSLGLSAEHYLAYEMGEKEYSIEILKSIAAKYKMDLNTLILGYEPRMNKYSLIRKDNGLVVSRAKDYEYRSLTQGFSNRKADIFIVTVEPKAKDYDIHEGLHEGQEFNLVLEGKLQIKLNGKEFILEEGDSLYFDSSFSHSMRALDGKRAKFLAVIL